MSKELFLKRSDRTRLVKIGAAVAVGGAAVAFFVPAVGVIVLLAGAATGAFGWSKSRGAVVEYGENSIVLKFKEPKSIPFSSITKVETLQTHDVDLVLQSGGRVRVEASKLDEEDGAWLRKALRKQVRTNEA